MTHPIEHQADHGRFQAVVDGLTCVTEYRLEAGVMTITHTDVPAALGGRGLAAALTRAALDHARDAGWKVRPQCTYAQAYMERHPDTHALLA
ncbi:MAG: GNAT family N-acetyltransferase [Burkholderiaceae bacterium]